MRSVVVVVVDRLGAGYLGPYGNTWVDTPVFNRLASESVVFEQALVDTPSLDSVYDSYLLGSHAMCDTSSVNALDLSQAAGASGIRTTLITDDLAVADHSSATNFAERIKVVSPEPSGASSPEEQTQLGRVFAAAEEWLDQISSPFLLWLHAQGMQGPWDAPGEFRELFADEEDPTPPSFVLPPDKQLGAAFDPDEVLGVTQAYAGQVLLLDICLGTLLQALEDCRFGDQTLVMLASPRGFPLGEHGWLGAGGDGLHGEVLHTPLLMRLPDPTGNSLRIQTLVQPGDVHPTVANWLGLSLPPCNWGRNLLELVQSDDVWQRDCVCSLADGQRSIRTPAWFLREHDPASNSLFAKPDDRWEVNEVADRCSDVVAGLRGALDEYQQLARANRLSEFPPLPALLLEPMD